MSLIAAPLLIAASPSLCSGCVVTVARGSVVCECRQPWRVRLEEDLDYSVLVYFLLCVLGQVPSSPLSALSRARPYTCAGCERCERAGAGRPGG